MLKETLSMSERMGVQGGWAGSLPPTGVCRWLQTPADPDADSASLAAPPTRPDTRVMGSAARGQRCATRSVVRSTLRRSTGFGGRKGYRYGFTVRVNVRGCRRCHR